NSMRPTLQRWAKALPQVFFHYTTGGAEVPDGEQGTNWRTYRYINYENGLERFSAVVHHGGAGIVHHTLRAGLPCVVWPQDYDQFDFAARLAHHGLARRCRRAAEIPQALAEALSKHQGAVARAAAATALRNLDLRGALFEV